MGGGGWCGVVRVLLKLFNQRRCPGPSGVDVVVVSSAVELAVDDGIEMQSLSGPKPYLGQSYALLSATNLRARAAVGGGGFGCGLGSNLMLYLTPSLSLSPSLAVPVAVCVCNYNRHYAVTHVPRCSRFRFTRCADRVDAQQHTGRLCGRTAAPVRRVLRQSVSVHRPLAARRPDLHARQSVRHRCARLCRHCKLEWVVFRGYLLRGTIF